MESADGAARTLPSLGRLSWGLPFGRAHGRIELSPSPSGQRLSLAPRSQVRAGVMAVGPSCPLSWAAPPAPALAPPAELAPFPPSLPPFPATAGLAAASVLLPHSRHSCQAGKPPLLGHRARAVRAEGLFASPEGGSYPCLLVFNIIFLTFFPPSQGNADPPAFLLRKQWTLYSVTPLYRFSYDRLKDYTRLLSAFIAAEKQKGLAVEVGIELDVKVVVSSLPDLKVSDQDQAAILVQVRSLPISFDMLNLRGVD